MSNYESTNNEEKGGEQLKHSIWKNIRVSVQIRLTKIEKFEKPCVSALVSWHVFFCRSSLKLWRNFVWRNRMATEFVCFLFWMKWHSAEMKRAISFKEMWCESVEIMWNKKGERIWGKDRTSLEEEEGKAIGEWRWGWNMEMKVKRRWWRGKSKRGRTDSDSDYDLHNQLQNAKRDDCKGRGDLRERTCIIDTKTHNWLSEIIIYNAA